jgi:hypothetical protein
MTDCKELSVEATLREESLFDTDCVVADDGTPVNTGADCETTRDSKVAEADAELVIRVAELEADEAPPEIVADTAETLLEGLAGTINEEIVGATDEALADAIDEAVVDTSDERLTGATDEALADATGVEDAATFVHPAGMLFCRLTIRGSFSKKVGYSTLRLFSVGPFNVRFALLLKTFVTVGV